MKAKPDLSVTVGDLRLKNPLILASGEMGRTARGLIKYAELGFAAVVSKSVTYEPWGGNPTPWYIYLANDVLTGGAGDPNTGFKAMVGEIKKAKEAIKDNALVVVNIEPEEIEQFAEMAVEFEKAGADALEIKLFGCPNYRADPTKPPNKIATHYWDSTPERMETAAKAVRSVVKIPIWVKCGAKNVESIRALERGGASAIHTVGGSARGLYIETDIDGAIGKPIVGCPDGSGAGGGPHNVCWTIMKIADLARTTRLPLTPSGGCWQAKDAISFIMAGAAAVQVYKAQAHKGPKWVKQTLDGIEQWMAEKGISSLDEIRGMTLKYLPPVKIGVPAGVSSMAGDG